MRFADFNWLVSPGEAHMPISDPCGGSGAGNIKDPRKRRI